MKIYTGRMRFERTGTIICDVFEVDHNNILEMQESRDRLKKHGYGIYFSEGNCDIYTMHGDMQLPYCVTSWAVIYKV